MTRIGLKHTISDIPHVAALMKRMEIEALYCKPNTSKPAPKRKIRLYLLHKLPLMRPNQVWAMDITCIPWRTASPNSLSCQTGSPAGRCLGGGRSRWRRTTASKR